MEALKILEGKPQLDWEYNEKADVLYISVGKPQLAVGVGIGEGGYRPLGREEKGDSWADDHRAKGAPNRRHHPSAMSLSPDKFLKEQGFCFQNGLTSVDQDKSWE
jgi:hypothetical protein